MFSKVVLLICEFMIVVETNIVQNKRHLNRSRYSLLDIPVADKLNRRDFGFDQDYYEKMPLLINALEENKETQQSVSLSIPLWLKRHRMNSIKFQTSTQRNFIRKTSPRPFVSEYKGPYPRPFGNTNGSSRSWVESYRNTERLKNLQELVKYLEKTVNAKFGDMYMPSKTQVAFSTVIVAPIDNTSTRATDGLFRNPKFKFKNNHNADPLYSFRPDHPQDVNLLADDFKLVSNSQTNNINKYKYSSKITLSTPYRTINKNCINKQCSINNKNTNIPAFIGYNEMNSFDESNNNKTKSVNFMLNLYPLKSTNNANSEENVFDSSKVHFTTLKPLVHFRRKPIVIGRQNSLKNKKYNVRIRTASNEVNSYKAREEEKTTTAATPKMIVHLNVISIPKPVSDFTSTENDKNLNLETTTPLATTQKIRPKYVEDFPEINLSSIEDYHVGSSGILPVEPITYTPPPVYPITTPIVLPFVPDTTPPPVTFPPDIIKFSPEDAKVPDQYLNLRKSDISEDYAENLGSIKFGDRIKSNKEFEQSTLAVRLKNSLKATTETTTTFETTTDNPQVISDTYVPQINGHYRNIRYKSLSMLLKENSEKYRKKLENFITASRKSTYGPVYVEIQRNHTINNSN